MTTPTKIEFDARKALGLPRAYKIAERALGHIERTPNREYAEVVLMRSTTPGHVPAYYARFVAGVGWSEIRRPEYLATIKLIFQL